MQQSYVQFGVGASTPKGSHNEKESFEPLQAFPSGSVDKSAKTLNDNEENWRASALGVKVGISHIQRYHYCTY
jgi:hypothetical protein